MIIFFTLAVLLVLVALAILLPGLFRNRKIVTVDRDDKNIAMARERLAEIENDLSIGTMDEASYQRVREEIEASLTDDLSYEKTSTEARTGGQWAAVVITFMLPVLAAGIYLVIGTPAAINTPPTPSSQGLPATVDTADVPGMIATLAVRLQESPNDAEGWALLGRSYMATSQYELAIPAYEKLLELAGEHPLILLMLADALTMSEQGQVSENSQSLIARALELDPDNPQGLWMAGIGAIQKRDPARAISYWERLEPMLSESPEQQAEIRSLIENARSMTATASPAADSEEDIEPPRGATPEKISVRVDIDPSMKSQVQSEDTVFIFARAVDGPPMPLAARRFVVSDLPIDLILDDSDAMTPAMALSQFDRVIVAARVSASGNAIAQPGDIEGSSGTVEPGTEERVEVVINQVVD